MPGGGLEIAEFWPGISSGQTLQVHQGLMKSIDVATKGGNIMLAAWASFLFAIVVAVYSILFTKKMMDLAKKTKGKYTGTGYELMAWIAGIPTDSAFLLVARRYPTVIANNREAAVMVSTLR